MTIEVDLDNVYARKYPENFNNLDLPSVYKIHINFSRASHAQWQRWRSLQCITCQRISRRRNVQCGGVHCTRLFWVALIPHQRCKITIQSSLSQKRNSAVLSRCISRAFAAYLNVRDEKAAWWLSAARCEAVPRTCVDYQLTSHGTASNALMLSIRSWLASAVIVSPTAGPHVDPAFRIGTGLGCTFELSLWRVRRGSVRIMETERVVFGICVYNCIIQ